MGISQHQVHHLLCQDRGDGTSIMGVQEGQVGINFEMLGMGADVSKVIVEVF